MLWFAGGLLDILLACFFVSFLLDLFLRNRNFFLVFLCRGELYILELFLFSLVFLFDDEWSCYSFLVFRPGRLVVF